MACRWGTELNGLAPVIITCDPDGRGRQLEEWEVAKHREEARARWVADLLDGLGRPEIATAARYGDIAPSIATELDLVLVPGRSGYAALAIETGGIIPLVGPGRAGRAASIIETAQLLKRATALVLLDRGTVESAVLRVGPADILDDGSVQRWWSRTSETKLAVPDRPELNVDGVTFRTMVDDIQFPNAATLP